ncbi:MAG: Lrp/AsnC family transcriptional regulator [Rhodospirillales bacterium]
MDKNNRKRLKLDRIHRIILRELQANGRLSNVELARRASISAPPCLRRVRALENDGYIRGYHADVDEGLLGYKEEFFALVGLQGQSQGMLQEFEKMVAVWPEIRECHMIRGGGDFLLKVVARDKEHRDALTMRLTEAAHVVNVTTFETIRTSKRELGPPVLADD